MSPGPRVRLYGPADLDAVLALVRELQVHELQYYPLMKPPEAIGPWYVERLLQDVAAHRGALMVAEADGAVVGYASLLAVVRAEEEEDFDEIAHSYAYVGDLAVAASHRRAGIGKSLLEACEAEARAAGQRHLRLNVLAGNNGARAFYAALGFGEHLLMLDKPLP